MNNWEREKVKKRLSKENKTKKERERETMT